MPILRLPLFVPTEPRNSNNLDKDSLLQNCYIDKDPTGIQYVVKRPGFYVGSEAITTGLNRGIYVNPNNVTGGNPGEVEVWYIDSTGELNSISSSFPSENEFRNFSFDVTQAPGDSANNVYELSGTNVKLRVGVTDNPVGTDWIFMYLTMSDDITIYGQIEGGGNPPASGTYNIEVKLETGNYNLYLDAVFVMSLAENIAPLFSSPALIQIGFFPVVTNVQFTS